MADQSKETTRQASELELAHSRQLRVRRETHPLDDYRDVQINYGAIGDWLGLHPRTRRNETPAPVQRCGHCGEYPVSGVEWRPWHPHFALLCSRCRSQVYLMAERCAKRQGRRLFDTLNEVVAVLHLGE